MIAFVHGTDVAGALLDDVEYTALYHAIFGWLLLAMCFHTTVVLCTGGWKEFLENGPIWWKVTRTTKRMFCSEQDTGVCRIARYYKCQKRARRRGRRDPSRQCFFQCAFAKLHMPAPLPYRRRRRADARSPTGTSSSELDADRDESCEGKPSTPEQILDAASSSMNTAEVHSIDVAPTEQPVPTEQPTNNASKPKKHRKSRRPSSTTQTPLIDVARMQHWSLLLERATQDKKAARYTDADGLLPLHWAVAGGPPIEVVEALLKAYPKGANAVDGEGSNALHFATHYGANVAVVKLLLSANTKSIRQLDKHGRSPLYHAVDKRANLDVLRTLVKADPSMITTPCLPPDEELAKKIRARDKRPLEHRTPLFMAWAHVVLDGPSREKREGRLWEKADLLLRAAYAKQSAQRIHRMVHATVTLDCYLPPHILNIALEMFPEQLGEREEGTGRVPLAIAAAAHQLLIQRSQEMIQLLVGAHPQAARISDNSSRTPLSLAVDSGKAWKAGVEDLFRAAPDLINWRDGSTMIYPALLSAASEPTKETESVMKGRRIYSAFPQRQSKKTQDWLSRAESTTREEQLCEWRTADSESRHLSTVFELLRSDPSMMK